MYLKPRVAPLQKPAILSENQKKIQNFTLFSTSKKNSKFQTFLNFQGQFKVIEVLTF